MTTSTRLGIQLLIETDAPRADQDVNAKVIEYLDSNMAVDLQGPISSRPAPGVRGRFYTATDQSNAFYRDNGSTWVRIPDFNAPEATPTGTVASYLFEAAPEGWMLMNGQAVTTGGGRNNLRDLLIAGGSRWGSSGGNPLLPNMAGRTSIGTGTGPSISARVLGQFVGSETHTLSAAQSGLPAHNHDQQWHNHTQQSHTHTQQPHRHTASGSNNFGQQVVPVTMGGPDRFMWVFSESGSPLTSWDTATNNSMTAINNATTAQNIANTAQNASASHPNMQPSAVFNWIVKL